jgi:hypothetical protein
LLQVPRDAQNVPFEGLVPGGDGEGGVDPGAPLAQALF